MRKGFKKFIAVAAATVMAAGVLSACGTEFVTPEGAPPADAEVLSNGGFVVGKGDYYYFINGVEAYTADNTYGTPVKGALMRIKKEDLKNKTNKAEVVIPSLMSAGDYEAGLFIYGDRIYYATPNNVPDPVSGEILTDYLDFKSAKLDGTDIQSYVTLDSNTVDYRFAKVGDTVYLLYFTNNDLYSYNTAAGISTLLAHNATKILFDESSVENGTVYYTMAVNNSLDTDLTGETISYNQIYRVGADATEAPYQYQWDMDYINEELDGEMPYTNLGEIVLDGIGKGDNKTQFTHSDKEATTLGGWIYELRSYENGGIYFTRTPAQKGSDTTTSSDNNGKLYFLGEDKLKAGFDSVAGNDGDALEYLASPSTLTSKATDTALFYRDAEGKHHYLYVKDSLIYRADVGTDGKSEKEQVIAYGVSGATLVSVDQDTDEKYDYLYFTRSNGSGRSIERVVFNGDSIESADVYNNIAPYGTDKAPYEPVKVLNIEHADGWYAFELIGTDLFFADADSDIASTSFNYIGAVSLANAEGKLMNNVELAAFTKKYDSIMSSDSNVGLLAKLTADGNSKLSTALRYYFLTGETSAFDDNIKEAAEEYGKSETYLYTQSEQDAFVAFNNNEGYTDENNKKLFDAADYKDGDENYRTIGYFITKIGEETEADRDAQTEYWRNTLSRYTETEEEEEGGLPAWAWALIGIGIGIVVILAVGIPVFIVLRKRKKGEAPKKEERMAVDTTDDRSVDVYSDDVPEETPAEEAPVEEVPVEEAPVEEAPAEEVPAEEVPAEEVPVEEAPAEETKEEPEA